MLIREADSRDIAVITEFNLSMALETEQVSLVPETAREGVAAVFADATRGVYVVAVVNERVVASLMITREWSDWRNGVFWWIQSVYVVPEYRGRGIFRALYAYLQQRAATEPDVCGLRLYVAGTNADAQQTYAKLGMVATPYRVYEALACEAQTPDQG